MTVTWAPREGTAEARAHWDKIRAGLAAGRPRPEQRRLPTLAEQADRQIARLRREIDEWCRIKACAAHGVQP